MLRVATRLVGIGMFAFWGLVATYGGGMEYALSDAAEGSEERMRDYADSMSDKIPEGTYEAKSPGGY
jgi:hypothetical protein